MITSTRIKYPNAIMGTKTALTFAILWIPPKTIISAVTERIIATNIGLRPKASSIASVIVLL